ncbi:MAG TPA: hypothetical protein DC034_10380, partial [Clostridium sp.]|nr:hypothetical protein [Clostridium sp.]
KNGSVVEGESNIPQEAIRQNSSIDRIFIEPENARALKEAVDAILDADAVILGPGSLYTSVIPNLLVKDIAGEMRNTNALKLYVSNIMTQPGETDGFAVEDHIRTIFDHVGSGIIDYVIVNVGKINRELEGKYKEEESHLVKINEEAISSLGVKVIEGDFISAKNGLIRHNSEKLASILIETIMDKKLLYDRKKIIEYFYLSERLKEIKR